MSDNNKTSGIMGELPISRVLFLETLPDKLRSELSVLNLIVSQLAHASEAAEIQRKSKEGDITIIPVVKEFGKESLDAIDPDPYDSFSPYLNPIFNLQSVVENLSSSMRRLNDLDGFLSSMGITITELIEIDRETLITKMKEYRDKNKDIL